MVFWNLTKCLHGAGRGSMRMLACIIADARAPQPSDMPSPCTHCHGSRSSGWISSASATAVAEARGKPLAKVD